jgi:dihydrofolate reductase
MKRVCVFVASSLDGFIAGPKDELDWLSIREGVQDTFTPFLERVGAILMGRRTFDVVCRFEEQWPYGERPLLVATSRSLEAPRPSVQPVTGGILELVGQAKEAAGRDDVYVDGGQLIRTSVDAGLVDEITVTLMPVILGQGIPLFAGASQRHHLELLRSRPIGGGLVELKYGPRH